MGVERKIMGESKSFLFSDLNALSEFCTRAQPFYFVLGLEHGMST